MNRLSFKDRARIVQLLTNGCTMSQLQRRTGFSRSTVLRGVVEMATPFAALLAEHGSRVEPHHCVLAASDFARRYKRIDRTLNAQALVVLRAHDFFCLQKGWLVEKLVALSEPNEKTG